jgi:hypothetical protein
LSPCLDPKCAHAGIQLPDYRGALDAHLKAGGHVVPLDVRFAPDGTLRVFTVAPGVAGVNPGDRLLSINGRSTDQMLAAMLSRSIGETSAFQHAFVTSKPYVRLVSISLRAFPNSGSK